MSSSVDLLSAVDDFPLGLRAPLFLADGRASRLIFVGTGVSTIAGVAVVPVCSCWERVSASWWGLRFLGLI